MILITALGGRYSGHIEGMQKPSNVSSVIRLARSRGTLETSCLAQELRTSPAAPVLPATNGPLGLHIPCTRSLTLIWLRRKAQVLTMACKALGDLNVPVLWPHLLLSPSFLLLHLNCSSSTLGHSDSGPLASLFPALTVCFSHYIFHRICSSHLLKRHPSLHLATFYASYAVLFFFMSTHYHLL